MAGTGIQEPKYPSPVFEGRLDTPDKSNLGLKVPIDDIEVPDAYVSPRIHKANVCVYSEDGAEISFTSIVGVILIVESLAGPGTDRYFALQVNSKLANQIKAYSARRRVKFVLKEGVSFAAAERIVRETQLSDDTREGNSGT